MSVKSGEGQLESMCPEPLIQFNPSYEPGARVEDLAAEGGFGNANLITRESRILTTAIILPRLPF